MACRRQANKDELNHDNKPSLLSATPNYAAAVCGVLRSKMKSITVRDVDLSTEDVSRLRQAWCAALNPATAARCGFSEPLLSNIDTQREGARIGSDTIVLQDGDNNGDDVRLVFAGKDLQKGRPLLGYGVGNDSTVHVLGRLRGGAQLGKVVKGRSQVRAS